MKSGKEFLSRHLKLLLGSFVVGTIFFSCGLNAAESPEEDKVLPFLKTHKFVEIKISPTGEYLAVTVPLSGRSSLAILDRKTMALKGHVTFPAGIHVYSFEWANDQWIIYSIAEQFGGRAASTPTGELYPVNVNGKSLYYGGNGNQPLIGARTFRYNRDSAREVSAEIFDTLPDSEDELLIAVSPWNDEFTQLERINIYDAVRTVLWKVPVRNAQCKANVSKSILVCSGNDNKNNSRMLIGRGDKKDWQVLNDQSLSKQTVIPIGFKNEKQLYVRVDQPQGPDEIHLLDVDSGERKLASRDPVVDPLRIFYSPKTFEPYGVLYESGKPRVEYLAPDNEYAKLHKKLQASFTDAVVLPGATTSDLSSSIFRVISDRIASDFYFYDQKQNNAQFMVSVTPWLDPNKLAAMEPIKFEARDRTPISGFLTKPRDSKEKQMPLILMPHGGPYGVSDNWEYNEEVQMLAANGFAVLQVNFRGSGGRGRQFMEKGYQNWGLAMQDDLTDATRWAIAEGIADPKRICIFGASYGGYAALMGAAKEPGIYQCAVGYIGVYDLPLMFKKGDIAKNRYAAMELTEHMGVAGLEAVSPVNLADRIRIPVMLAAGNIDWRAPPIHTSKMCDALKKAGGKPECYFYNGEGHGFVGGYAREDFYRKLVMFFQAHLNAK